jgi:hypothetical protein
MFLDVVTKVGERLMRTQQEHFVHAGNGIADSAEELMLGAHIARVLARVVMMRFDSLRPIVRPL